MTDPRCRCNGTGWVIFDIPQQFQAEYGGYTQGWAGCNVEEHRMNADATPPEVDQPTGQDEEER